MIGKFNDKRGSIIVQQEKLSNDRIKKWFITAALKKKLVQNNIGQIYSDSQNLIKLMYYPSKQTMEMTCKLCLNTR